MLRQNNRSIHAVFSHNSFLVSDEHDDDVRVCVVLELPQPPLHVLVGEVLGDVVHQERAHGPAVVAERSKRRELNFRAKKEEMR
jgi:hypothetical protein